MSQQNPEQRIAEINESLNRDPRQLLMAIGTEWQHIPMGGPYASGSYEVDRRVSLMVPEFPFVSTDGSNGDLDLTIHGDRYAYYYQQPTLRPHRVDLMNRNIRDRSRDLGRQIDLPALPGGVPAPQGSVLEIFVGEEEIEKGTQPLFRDSEFMIACFLGSQKLDFLKGLPRQMREQAMLFRDGAQEELFGKIWNIAEVRDVTKTATLDSKPHISGISASDERYIALRQMLVSAHDLGMATAPRLVRFPFRSGDESTMLLGKYITGLMKETRVDPKNLDDVFARR